MPNKLTRRRALELMAAMCAATFAGAQLVGCGNTSADSDEIKLVDLSGKLSDVKRNSFGYGVSCSCKEATSAGMSILAQGGNAMDAAIAVSYACGVAQPYGSGSGGGGGMLVYDIVSKDATFIDYYDAAPASFSQQDGNVCVPGFVKGMERAHELFGSMDMASLIQPAIDLAKNGFELSEHMASMAQSYKRYLADIPGYWDAGEIIGEGDTLVQDAYAAVLEQIAIDGADAFYEGDVAKSLMDVTGFTASDLASYEPQVREAVEGACYGFSAISAPAPFSGITLIQMLKLLEELDAPDPQQDTPGYLAALKAASDDATAVRAQYIADPDYVDVDSVMLLSDAYIQSVVSSQDLTYDSELDDDEGESTTAFTVIDNDGLVVSVTNTLGDFYGCGACVEGFHLNGHMGSFSSAGVNAYEPGKRPRSFTAPTIMLNSSFVLSIGTSGGKRIPKLLQQVLFDVFKNNEDVQLAVNKNRALFQDDVLYIEQLEDREDFVKPDEASGYSVVRKGKGDFFGSVQVAGYLAGHGLFGATDSRREGSFETAE